MVFLLDFFTSKVGIIILILLGGWWWHTSAVSSAIEAAAVKANAERAVIVQKYEEVDEINNDLQREEVKAAYEEGQKSMKGKLNNVPKKVTKVADSMSTITVGFVQSYQTAFDLPTIPIPAGGTVDSPSGVPISDIAKADVINGSIAIDYKREAVAWREWFKRNKASHDKYCAESKSCAPATTANPK